MCIEPPSDSGPTAMTEISNVNISENVPLPSPAALQRETPRTEALADFIAHQRQAIHDIIFGDDPTFLMVVGPCSIHDVEAGLEYAERLTDLAKEVQDKIMLVMRVYFEKPRTAVGWKGLIMDPHLDGTDDIPTGLRQARQFLRDVVALGLPTATELLDPITPQYIADLICWSAIGARTTESQTHRQMASGLSMPLGFKNTTTGAVMPAVNAIQAAMQSQTFLGVSDDGVASSVTTKGNPNCHVILRGSDTGPNYDAASIRETEELLRAHRLPLAIMVDASHGNSNKDPMRQPDVLRKVVSQLSRGNHSVIGAMIESNLKAGSQRYPQRKEKLDYGRSITDGCIDWDTTRNLIHETYNTLSQA